MKNYNSKNDLNIDIEAVITSYNQGTMILEAVQSICNQTLFCEIEVELMKNYNSKNDLNIDIEAVITSYNQGTMILEAVQSICNQTLLPQRIIIVDDGSTDKDSLAVLEDIQNNPCMPMRLLSQAIIKVP